MSLSPSISVAKEKDGIYDVVVNTIAPNQCYQAELDYSLELPPGVDFSIFEHAHLTLNASYNGGLNRMCGMAIKPLSWNVNDLELGVDKTHLIVYIVVNKAVVGSAAIQLPVSSDFMITSDDYFPLPWNKLISPSDDYYPFPWKKKHTS